MFFNLDDESESSDDEWTEPEDLPKKNFMKAAEDGDTARLSDAAGDSPAWITPSELTLMLAKGSTAVGLNPILLTTTTT